MTPLWVYFIGPIVTLLTAGIGLYAIFGQLKLSRLSLMSSTLVDWEREFWAAHKDIYTKVENGYYDGKALAGLKNDRSLADFEGYMNLFNTLGILVRGQALDGDVVLQMCPYRLCKLMDLPVAQEIMRTYPEFWQGLIYLQQLLIEHADRHRYRMLKLQQFKLGQLRKELSGDSEGDKGQDPQPE